THSQSALREGLLIKQWKAKTPGKPGFQSRPGSVCSRDESNRYRLRPSSVCFNPAREATSLATRKPIAGDVVDVQFQSRPRSRLSRDLEGLNASSYSCRCSTHYLVFLVRAPL